LPGEATGLYLENFLVDSWEEHARQQDRFTLADREFEERVHSFVLNPPRPATSFMQIESSRTSRKKSGTSKPK
jgi:hypothetical protein